MNESRPDGAILTCRDLAVGYGEAVLCGGIDLTVRAGEYISLVGPHGCGKSALIAVMLGALEPMAGQVIRENGLRREEICFPSTPLSGVYREAMRDYFRKEITAWSFVFLIFGLLFWLIIHFARRKLLSRWTYLILLLAVPILFFAGKDVGEISADLRNGSYVVYNGAYRQWSTGVRHTNYYTALQDGDGEITLHSPSKLTQNGTFFGYVVYGEHTKYVVYVGKSLPKDP